MRGRGVYQNSVDGRRVLLFLGILNRSMIQFRLPIGRISFFLFFLWPIFPHEDVQPGRQHTGCERNLGAED